MREPLAAQALQQRRSHPPGLTGAPGQLRALTPTKTAPAAAAAAEAAMRASLAAAAAALAVAAAAARAVAGDAAGAAAGAALAGGALGARELVQQRHVAVASLRKNEAAAAAGCGCALQMLAQRIRSKPTA